MSRAGFELASGATELSLADEPPTPAAPVSVPSGGDFDVGKAIAAYDEVFRVLEQIKQRADPPASA